jgi:hypothetical protein
MLDDSNDLVVVHWVDRYRDRAAGALNSHIVGCGIHLLYDLI